MIIGQSPQIMNIKRMIKDIAKTNENALIIGEVGSGKKFVAHEIHQRSTQKRKSFIVLNCSAVGDTITDTDIYGEHLEHPRGIQRKIGLLEQANRGILFLENIDELEPEFQHKFFNVLKENKFRRPGEDTSVEVDLRVFAATSDEKLLKKDTFRKDFLSILNTFTVQIPPLRSHRQDIPVLFTHFLEQYCEELNREIPPVSSDIFESLMEYEWSGNVHELKKTVRNLVHMSPEGELSIHYLPFEIKKHPFEFLEGQELPEAVGELEKYLIKKALGRFAGNQSRAAHALNVSETTLRYKMRKYSLASKSF